MDAYERSIIRGIYESACMGSRAAMRILENLTTKRRRRGRCEVCDGPLRNRQKKFCSVLCANHAPRKTFTKGPKPKFTDQQIENIKQEYIVPSVPTRSILGRFQGGNSSALAKKYGVTPGTIIRWATGRKKTRKKSVKVSSLKC